MRVFGRTTGQKGFTILEIIIGLAVTAMLATTVAAAIPTVMKWAPRQGNKLGVEEDLTFARYWLTRDTNAAESYTSLTAPQYGYLQWRDFRAESMVTYKVTYSYDAASASLIREERQNDVVQTSLPIARKILQQSDVQFTWSPSAVRLIIALTATINDSPGVGSHSRTATVVTTLRPRSEPVVSPPDATPVLPPPAGSETYYVSGNPSIITGSLASGNGASLHDADAVYYVVDSASVPGGKAVSWSAASEVMTAPTTISQIEVRFTGKSSRQNVLAEFFVQDSAAGFPANGTTGFTFDQADTVTTRSFFLDDTALAYVNSLSQRKVTLKIEASGNANFTLSTDQVLFIASP
ncbi:MAG: prepilin-type N-terminal cleavage/methylation domain-containing protein [Chloroflexi bacterium]|nr:prepilin-type N-terminal cleavage/methylation domain-containing protein [Chloroflexota bacterium]